MLASILAFWKSLSYTTRFSIIAFVAILPMGLFSMGILGALLYYPVSFFFTSYPTLNDWTGDWVWPATIGVGMFWSFGFIWAGLAWHFLRNKLHSIHILRVIYAIICWAWAAVLWYGVISSNLS